MIAERLQRLYSIVAKTLRSSASSMAACHPYRRRSMPTGALSAASTTAAFKWTGLCRGCASHSSGGGSRNQCRARRDHRGRRTDVNQVARLLAVAAVERLHHAQARPQGYRAAARAGEELEPEVRRVLELRLGGAQAR